MQTSGDMIDSFGRRITYVRLSVTDTGLGIAPDRVLQRPPELAGILRPPARVDRHGTRERRFDLVPHGDTPPDHRGVLEALPQVEHEVPLAR